MIPLAFYEPFRVFVNNVVGYSSTDQVPWTSIFAGASSGAVGGKISFSGREKLLTSFSAALGNPMFLIKARMQVILQSVSRCTDSQYPFRHTLLLYQLELNIITKTPARPSGGYSKLRVSVVFSVA